MKRQRVIFVATITVLIAIFFILVLTNSASTRLKEQLDLGQKYMDDLDYEQAIIAYEEAINTDPKCLEAYLGLTAAYEASGNDNIAYVYEVLLTGYELTQDGRIEALINEMGGKLEEGRNEIISSTKEAEEIEQAEETESMKKSVSAGTILIKEFAEAPTIFGKP